jgi:hypothetical protein
VSSTSSRAPPPRTILRPGATSSGQSPPSRGRPAARVPPPAAPASSRTAATMSLGQAAAPGAPCRAPPR